MGARKHVIKLIIIFLLMKHFPSTPPSSILLFNYGTLILVLLLFFFRCLLHYLLDAALHELLGCKKPEMTGLMAASSKVKSIQVLVCSRFLEIREQRSFYIKRSPCGLSLYISVIKLMSGIMIKFFCVNKFFSFSLMASRQLCN